VLLVPNKSLDTPNYKLERLKHDDPRLDNLDSSYKLAEEVDDPTNFTRRSQERTNKQEPVIKGVVFDGPAPVAAPKPEAPAMTPAPIVAPAPAPVHAPVAKAPAEKGFFGFIKSLFGAAPAPAPAVAKPAAPEANKAERADGNTKGARDGRGRGGRNGEGRGERVEGQGRNGERRDGNRPPRGEGRGERVEGQGRNGGERRNENRGEGRGERVEGQGRNGGQRRDGRRDNRSDAAPGEGTVIDNSNLLPAAEGAEASNDNGRRERRGGRGDNRRRQGTDNAETASQALADGGANAPVAEATEAIAMDGADGENAALRAPRERRSRDRYGRDRRGERGPREGEVTEATTGSETERPVAADTTVTEEAVEQRPSRSSYFAQAAAAPVAPAATPDAAPIVAPMAAPAVAVAPAVTPRAPEARTPVVAVAAPVTGMPKVAPYELSLDDLSRVAQGSGLEWVNSDATKVAQVQAAIAAEPQPIHVPREPKSMVLVDEGPLVLVETRKDLSDVTLPFESR
jgi:ribonuclease E